MVATRLVWQNPFLTQQYSNTPILLSIKDSLALQLHHSVPLLTTVQYYNIVLLPRVVARRIVKRADHGFTSPAAIV